MSLWTLTFNAKSYASQTVVMPANGKWQMAKQAELQQLQSACLGRTSAKACHAWESFTLIACGNANPDSHILNSHVFDLTTSNQQTAGIQKSL